MSLIPDEELRPAKTINFAPMVDFLFLVIAVLATLAVAKTSLYDSEVALVKVNQTQEGGQISDYPNPYIVNLSISAVGSYKWITEVDEYIMQEPQAIQKELLKQQEIGLLSKERTKILLHIDKDAPWEPVAKLIFAVREAGFELLLYTKSKVLDENPLKV